MSRYAVKIYDKHDNLLGVLPLTVTPEYRRRKNQATGFSFGVLADDERVEVLRAARFCTLLRNGVEKAAGYIVDRDFSQNPYRIDCITNEALLRRNITPATWKGWNHMDLADAVKDALLDFSVQVRNTADHWGAAVDSYRVDLATEPGEVHLAKDSNGQYYPYGYIVVEFDFGSITRYQLLRWMEITGEGSGGFTHEDHEIPGQTIKMQYAVSDNGVSWSEWSTELQSVFPAEDGVALSGNERYIRIKANLYTDDTEAPDAEDNPVGLTPRLLGVEVIARKPGIVTEGNIAESTGVILEGYTFERENALRVIQSLCEEHGYEFQVDGQKQLHFAEQLGEDKTHIVLQRTQNMNIQTLQDNAMNLQNVVLCLGAGEGPGQLQTTLRDEESITFFGDEFPGLYTDNQADTMEKLTTGGQRYLQEHAWPKQEFVARVAPEEFFDEEFGCYDMVTVVDPVRGTVTELRILDEEVREDTGGEDVTLGLNTTLDNIIEKIVKPSPIPSEGVEPAAPTGLILITGPEFIELRWSGKADYFVIEHSTNGTEYKVLESKWTGNRFRHDGLTLGSQHWYRILGVVAGKQSAVVGPVSAKAWDDYYPDQVAWAACSFIYKIILNWHPVANVVGYEVRTDTNFGANDNKLVFRGDALTYVIENPVLRDYTFYIKALDRSGKYSHDHSSINLTRPVPSTPAQPVITEFFSALWIEIQPVADQGIMGYNVYTTPCDEGGTPTGDTKVDSYPSAQRVTYYAQPKQSYLIEISAFDVIGEGPKSSPVQATTREIDDIAQFAQEIIPPRVVDVLPTLPDPDYPEGCLVVLTTDHKLYRSTGAEWTADIETADLAGQIVAEQIAEEAIQAVHIAEHAVESAKLAIGAVTADILAANAVTETKISDNAISTPKIQTGAVTAGKVAAEAITTEKLNALAVTADKIAANAITAAKIAAGAIIAEKIATGAVTTDKLDALAVTAAKIAANAITADKIAANAITAAKIAAGAIGVNELAAQAVTAEKLAAGSIEAYVAAVQQAFIDSAHIINVQADKIKVGGEQASLPIAIDPSQVALYRFDNSLLSTQGQRPVGIDPDADWEIIEEQYFKNADLLGGKPAEAYMLTENLVGTIKAYGGTTPPAGYLECNGQAVSRTTYAALLSVIGTTWGPGDGSTTFNVPDLRGEFLRGWDHGRGIDSGRTLGSSQLDQMQRITGSLTQNLLRNPPTTSGAISSSHDDYRAFSSGGLNMHRHTLSFDSANSPSARTSLTTSGETRSRNKAVMYIIKY